MEQRKIKLLKILNYGQDNSKSRKELVKQLKISDRALRQSVFDLRSEGVPICSNSKNAGYYIAGSDEEVKHFISENRKRAMVLLRICKKVKEGYGATFYDYGLEDLVE